MPLPLSGTCLYPSQHGSVHSSFLAFVCLSWGKGEQWTGALASPYLMPSWGPELLLAPTSLPLWGPELLLGRPCLYKEHISFLEKRKGRERKPNLLGSRTTCQHKEQTRPKTKCELSLF